MPWALHARPRDKVGGEGLRAPADGGPDAVGIEALGVTTGGFEPAALPIDPAVRDRARRDEAVAEFLCGWTTGAWPCFAR
jgi:hypothetical protein